MYDGEVIHRLERTRGQHRSWQWMTARVEVLRQEFHSREFTRTGGLFRVVERARRKCQFPLTWAYHLLPGALCGERVVFYDEGRRQKSNKLGRCQLADGERLAH